MNENEYTLSFFYYHVPISLIFLIYAFFRKKNSIFSYPLEFLLLLEFPVFLYLNLSEFENRQISSFPYSFPFLGILNFAIFATFIDLKEKYRGVKIKYFAILTFLSVLLVWCLFPSGNKGF